jgi:phosphatidate cytidylyltransferase
MLAQRVITAAVGIPVLIALALIGGTILTIAIAAILVLASLEFFAVTDPENRNAPDGRPRLRAMSRPLWQPRPPALIGAIGVASLVFTADERFDYWTAALVATVGLTFLWLVIAGEAERGLADWLWVISGVVYVGFLGSYLVLVSNLDGDRDWLLVAVFGTFAADTAAYAVGRSIGRRHITPRISPGKTLEGSLGGLAGGAVVVLALNWILGLDVDLAEILPLALLLPIAAMIGDLAESLIKRGAGVKDTSELVPGHGGFLDRLDSILFTVPLVYYYVIWVVY